MSKLSVFFLVLATALLFFLGWTLYEPIYNLVTGKLNPAPVPPPVTDTTPAPSEEDADSAASQTPEPVTPVALGVQGIFLPEAVMRDSANLPATLADLKEKGINTILFDIKDERGFLHHTSKLAIAQKSLAVPATTYDLASTVTMIKEAGLTPMGRVYAFKDTLASSANLEIAVGYVGTTWAWLDNSALQGGKTWLNPYDAVAQQYIKDVIKEATDAGVERILLAGVQFPQGFALDKADYGPQAATISKAAVLQEFAATVTTQAKDAGATLFLYSEAPTLLGKDATHLGGDAFGLIGTNNVISLFPSAFEAGVNGEVTVPDPAGDLAGTVGILAQSVRAKLPAQAGIVALVQAYPTTGQAALPTEALAQQLQALNQENITDYILYHPQGAYPDTVGGQ